MSALIQRRSPDHHPQDFHRSPPQAAWGLVAVEEHALRRARAVWEPACGDGALVRPLRAAGLRVAASDLVDRGCEGAWTQDFLDGEHPYLDQDAIVTNPPFKLAQRFVMRAIERAPFVAMLLPLRFLEGGKRVPWLQRTPLSYVWVFADRLPMMHRDGYTGKKASNPHAFAWFVWGPHGVHSMPEVRWIERRDIEIGKTICKGAS